MEDQNPRNKSRKPNLLPQRSLAKIAGPSLKGFLKIETAETLECRIRSLHSSSAPQQFVLQSLNRRTLLLKAVRGNHHKFSMNQKKIGVAIARMNHIAVSGRM